MATAEGISRRRRQGSVLGWRLVALWGRVASVRGACVLGRWRNLHARHPLLLLLLLHLVLNLQLLVHLHLQLLLLLQSILHGHLSIRVIGSELAGGLVQDVDLVRCRVADHDRLSRHGRLHHASSLIIHAVLLLLARNGETLELLRGSLDIAELLLKLLLLLGKVQVRVDKLGVHFGVHMLNALVIDLDLRRSKNLLGRVLGGHCHVVALLLVPEAGKCRLGSIVILSRAISEIGGIPAILMLLRLLLLLGHGVLRRER